MHTNIESLIPHRPPMRWINAHLDGDGKTFTATACFSAGDYCVAADSRVTDHSSRLSPSPTK